MITLKNITKEFYKTQRNLTDILLGRKSEKVKSLNNINLEIKKGECIMIIGDNGSGKTTLLKIISKILTPTSGTIDVNTKITTLIQLGTGFQDDLDAIDNIYLYGVILGKSTKFMKKKIPNIIKFAELEGFENMSLKNYSSGMQSRLAFSIAIHTNPESILLDEVLAVGDQKFKEKCIKRIKEMKKKGVTIIYVTHYSNETDIFDRVIKLEKGKII